MKHRQIIYLLCITLPVCVLLRILQIKFTIDSTTGFIKQSYSDISILISLVVFAAAAVMLVLSRFTENIEKKPLSPQPFVAITCALTGVTFLYEGFANALSSNGRFSFLTLILCIASAIVFFAFGLSKIYPYKFPAFTLILPTLYYIVKLIKLFVSTSALSLVTENVFMLFANSALLWFSFEFARFENNFGALQKAPKAIFSCGITTSILCVVTALPKLLLFSYSSAGNIHADISSSLLMLSQTLFVLAYMVSNFCPKQEHVQKFVPKHS